MPLRTLSVSVIVILLSAIAARSQQSITFDQFANQIDPYFAPELVQDVRDALPQSPFAVWVYGVGDYTGDGVNDLALTIRKKSDNHRNIDVYFFVDDEGVLMPIRHEVLQFVELPIEVGVSINNGNVYTVQKLKEYDWQMLGYQYRDGVLMMVDKFITEPHGRMVRERYRNYQNLDTWQRYLTIPNGDSVFRSQFLTVPSYSRGRDVSAGYTATATAQLSRYVIDGNYYWKGPDDASAAVRSAYDDEFLYLNVHVRDDSVVPGGTDPGDTAVDRIDVWLDMTMSGDRFEDHHPGKFRFETDTNIYALYLTPGDFINKPAMIRTASANALDREQTAATHRLKAVSIRDDDGYSIKARIPWALLGFPAPPVLDDELMEFGMTVLVHDVDNRYRPEETTTLSTSIDFDSTKPATYGALVLVPDSLHYGYSENVFAEDIRERLQQVGF